MNEKFVGDKRQAAPWPPAKEASASPERRRVEKGERKIKEKEERKKNEWASVLFSDGPISLIWIGLEFLFFLGAFHLGLCLLL